MARTIATAVIVGGAAYVAYRCVRVFPSLIRVFWPSIPTNLAVP
ncbi:hypothetical protein HBA54_02195 [Pelagibius litoralis]|uniref:Tox-WTIP domain-containing protein n=1 Tax=Pelagibius litoralis TaxID=374515 RepID=A0A967C389_9PROT|nr:hypothetical protein [Pelagibius litoralis]